MLTKGQQDDILACFAKGMSEVEALNFIMTKYCRCELPAYKPRETVYEFVKKIYEKNRNLLAGIK